MLILYMFIKSALSLESVASKDAIDRIRVTTKIRWYTAERLNLALHQEVPVGGMHTHRCIPTSGAKPEDEGKYESFRPLLSCPARSTGT